MAEYIEREAVVKAFCESCSDYIDNKCTYEGVCETNVIATVPTADVQPVRRGKWIEIAGYGGMCNTYYQCPFPECNTTESIPSNYCPNCGAELRGIDNE